ncbi:hypothetical protein ACFO0M_19625 [Micromonospora mangrovi]|uniref:Flavin reductase n=2 Tax=Micromonospora TaxID=1873 RepID=A0AAU7M322_9ACTN
MTAAGGATGPAADEHAPVTPEWSCGTCGDAWPCSAKRARLLVEYQVDLASLSVYLGSCLASASQDLRTAPVSALQDRFIGWLPRSPRQF